MPKDRTITRMKTSANGNGRCAEVSSQYRSHVKYQQIALFISSKK